MTEKEVFACIKPLLDGVTEGLYWDFKKTLKEDTAGIIKDILAFSNSDYEGDSYIIIGVSECVNKDDLVKIPLTKADRQRLNTDANNLYLPGKWNLHGLSADDLKDVKQFSAKLTEQLSSNMLISHPKCEFTPIEINKKRWLYVITIKKCPGVFVSKKDICKSYDKNSVVVKQGVIYVRLADTTLGAKTEAATATECIRVWKKYIDWLEKTSTESIT